jgi:hypothetical protein
LPQATGEDQDNLMGYFGLETSMAFPFCDAGGRDRPFRRMKEWDNSGMRGWRFADKNVERPGSGRDRRSRKLRPARGLIQAKTICERMGILAGRTAL